MLSFFYELFQFPLTVNINDKLLVRLGEYIMAGKNTVNSLNEPIDIAFSYLRGPQWKRGTLKFLSVLCCPPTLGISLCCNDRDRGQEFGECCPAPQPLSLREEIALDNIKKQLRKLKISHNCDEPGPTVTDELINEQVRKVLGVLNTHISSFKQGFSYHNAIIDAIMEIQQRQKLNEDFKPAYDGLNSYGSAPPKSQMT